MKDYYGNPSAYYPLRTPGVTTVINDLIPDPEWDEFVKEVGEEKAQQILEAAGQRGTAMHCFIENFILAYSKSGDPSRALKYTQEVSCDMLTEQNIPSNKIEKGRELFFNFYYSDYSSVYKNIISTEMPVFSPFLFYRGKIDLFYNIPHIGKSILDFKSSSSTIKKGSTKEKKYKLQLGGYALGVEHMFAQKNIKINKSSFLIIMTNSNIISEITCENEELEEQKNEFKTLIKEWHIKNKQSFLYDGA